MRKTYDDYGQDSPDWLVLVVLQLLEQGLKKLQACLNRPPTEQGQGPPRSMVLGLDRSHPRPPVPNDQDVSWNSPLVELHYAVDLNWQKWAAGNLEFSGAALAEKDLEDPDRAKKTRGKTFVRSIEQTALYILTKGVAYTRMQRDGKDEYFFLIPPELKEDLEALPAGEQDEAREFLFRPFTIGRVPLPKSIKPKRRRKAAYEKDEEELLSNVEADFPLTFAFTNDAGETARCRLCMQFHPLVFDEIEKRAYYPLVVELLFLPKVRGEGEDEILIDTRPDVWLPGNVENFWPPLFAFVGKAIDDIRTRQADREAREEGVERYKSGEEERREREASETEIRRQEQAKRATVGAVPEPQRRYLLEGRTILDRTAVALVNEAGALSLPSKWSKVPAWEELVKDEKDRILSEEGEGAFVAKSGAGLSRGPLLRKRIKAGPNNEVLAVVELTDEAEDALLDRLQDRHYARSLRDPDGATREYIIRRVRIQGGGYLETRLSWYNLGGPLVADWREEQQAELERQQKEMEGTLFADLETEEKKRIDTRLRVLASIRDAQPVMDHILRTFGQEGRNPLTIPAWELRTLLKCENDPHGLGRVNGCLRALEELRFEMRASSNWTRGTFLAEVRYLGKGPGGHGDGDFRIHLAPGAIGCLRVFLSAAGAKLTGGDIYSWAKRLTNEEREDLYYIRGLSTTLPHYYRAQGFTDPQRRLLGWLEADLTLRKDPITRPRKADQAKRTDPDANEPRAYRRDFCPLLDDGKDYHGALGHFRRNPEAGRRLISAGGTRPSSGKGGGKHAQGLLAVMGYELKRGPRSGRQNAKLIEQALGDLRFVVETCLGGKVGGRFQGTWLGLDDTVKLHGNDLKEVRWFLFLASDWRERMNEQLEAVQADRHAAGDTPYQVAVTEDREIKKRSEAERRGEAYPPEEQKRTGIEDTSLRVRLHAAREERGLTLRDAAKAFGVGKSTLDDWEKGRKPIPQERTEDILRWMEGQASSSIS